MEVRSCTNVKFVYIVDARIRVCQKAYRSLKGISKKIIERIIIYQTTKYPVTKGDTIWRRMKFRKKTMQHWMLSFCFNFSRRIIQHSTVKYDYYLKYYKKHFYYRFGRPQVDTCCQCEQLGVKLKGPSPSKEGCCCWASHTQTQSQKMLHVSQRDWKFDCMQNLHLPEIPMKDHFYLTQLNVNVFNIHN